MEKAVSVSVSEVLTVITKKNVTEPGEHRLFEYGSSTIKWEAVKLLREL